MTERPPAALFDSAVFIYAVGGEHPYREPCRHLLTAVADGRLRGEASVLAVEECLHQRARRTGDRESARRVAASILDLCTVRDLTARDMSVGLRLFAEHPALDARDAFHAATALGHDLPIIVSPGRPFDAVAGLTRVDPVETIAW